MIPVKLAEPIPLFVAVSDEATDYVVRARIFTLNPYTEIEAALALTLVPGSPGYYASSALAMPETANVHAVFSIFESDGTTLVAKAEEVYSLQEVDRIDGEEVLAVIEDDVIVGEIICE
jgi:hypothetical protein